MAIDRTELYEGGKAYWKAPFNGGMAMKLRPVTILSIERMACKVRVHDSGVETKLRFNQLQADDEYLSLRDRAAEEKRERIRREALSVPEAPPPRGPAVRLVPNSKPLTTTLGEVLAAKQQSVVLPSAEPKPPPVPEPPVAAPPAPPKPVAEEVPVVPPAKKKKVNKTRNIANAQFPKSGKYLTRLRTLRDETRQVAARGIGVSYQTLYSWEIGITRPRDDNAKKVSRYYKVPLKKIESYDLEREEREAKPVGKAPKPKSPRPKPAAAPQEPLPSARRPKPGFLDQVRAAKAPPPREAPPRRHVTVDDAINELGLDVAAATAQEPKKARKEDPRQQRLPFERWAQTGKEMLEPLALELAEIEEQLVPLEMRYQELRRRKTAVLVRKSAVEAALNALGGERSEQ